MASNNITHFDNLTIPGALVVTGTQTYTGNTTFAGTITQSTDGTGADTIFYSGTASSYFQWDASAATLLILGTAGKFRLGTFSGSTSGSGSVLSSSNTASFRVYTDDGGAAIASSQFVRAGVFRNLQTYTSGNREQESAGVVGQCVSVAGTNRHNMCGVMGSYEVRTSLTVDGQASSTDPWCQAAVIGRVGAGSSITTINSNGILAGVAAMSNTTSFSANNGTYAGFYAGKWTGTTNWGYGLYVDAVGSTIGAALLNTLTPDSTRSYAALIFGATRAGTAASITMAASTSQHCDPVQMKYSIAGSNPTSTSTVNGFYSNIAHSTTNMANLRLKTTDFTLDIQKNLQDAYCIQGEMDITTNSVTVGGEACAMGLTTSVTSAVTGNVWNTIMVFSTDQTMSSAANLFLSHRSTGTIGHAIYIEANSGTTVTDAIYINAAGTITNLFNFASATGPVATSGSVDVVNTSDQDSDGSLRITVAGTAYYIPIFGAGKVS